MGRMILSICAIVVAVGLGASTQQSRGSPPVEPPSPSTTQDYSTEQSAQGAATIPASESPSSRTGYQQDAPKEHGNPSENARHSVWWDTVAQWLMAVAAIGATVITAIATCLLASTLAATRKAAIYTRGMLREAKGATKAAQDAVRVTREAAINEGRPLMTFHSLEIKGGERGPWSHQWKFINTGRGPAYVTEAYRKRQVVPAAGREDPFEVEGTEPNKEGVVLIGEIFEFNDGILHKGEVAFDGRCTILARLTYSSAFTDESGGRGRTYVTEADARIAPKVMWNGQIIVSLAGGRISEQEIVGLEAVEIRKAVRLT